MDLWLCRSFSSFRYDGESMKKLLFALALLGLGSPAFGYSLTLSCTAPTTYTDGTPIATGITVTFNFYGALQGQPLALLTPTPLTSCSNVRASVDPGVRCYAATAIINGQESAQTTPVCFTVPNPTPSAPGGMSVTPVTVATTAYMELQVPNGFTFLAVGTVALGVPCDPNQGVFPFHVVPASAVTPTGNIKRLAYLAACST